MIRSAPRSVKNHRLHRSSCAAQLAGGCGAGVEPDPEGGEEAERGAPECCMRNQRAHKTQINGGRGAYASVSRCSTWHYPHFDVRVAGAAQGCRGHIAVGCSARILCMCGSLIMHAVVGPQAVALCSVSTGRPKVRPLMSFTPVSPTTTERSNTTSNLRISTMSVNFSTWYRGRKP